jgi:hypothetical protein
MRHRIDGSLEPGEHLGAMPLQSHFGEKHEPDLQHVRIIGRHR